MQNVNKQNSENDSFTLSASLHITSGRTRESVPKIIFREKSPRASCRVAYSGPRQWSSSLDKLFETLNEILVTTVYRSCDHVLFLVRKHFFDCVRVLCYLLFA